MVEVRKGKKPLGQHLLEKGLISKEQLRIALEEQRKTGLYLREVFLNLAFVSEEDILKFFEEELNIPCVNLSEYAIEPSIINLIPEKLARRYQTIPLFRIRDTLTVVMEDPLNVIGIDEISALTGLTIDPCICSKDDAQSGLRKFYGAENKLEMFDKNIDGDALDDIKIDNRIVRFVENMIRQAAEEKASDIHIEPDEGVLRIRFRVDGVMKEVASQPTVIHPAVVSRIKVLSDLDIAEKRLPQDGRFQMKLDDRAVDLRVSSFPTIGGENIVIRLLDKKNAILRLDDLGIDDDVLTSVKRMIKRPNGIMLVTGPTGSGKTSTLYAALQTINTLDRNIATLEDPVEYRLPFIRQTQINEDVGLTFAKGLRSLVRQDPDVIMVGEIRDGSSAEIALRSALTGHLVLSTLHTNDAIGAIARLRDMGIEPFLIASALIGVVAQRLLRRICPRCKQKYQIPEKTLQRLGVELQGGETWYRGTGCMHCHDSGYRGRVAIFEVVEMTDALRTSVLREDTLDRVRELARQEGMHSLRADGVAKARAGITTVEEVLRITKEEASSADAPAPVAEDVNV